MSVDHLADIKRYRSDVNEKAVAAIVKHLGVAIKSPDASLVSCTSKEELKRVRESWLKKKLALGDDDAALDKAVAELCAELPGHPRKPRVTFYYLLAEKFGKLESLAG